MKAIKKERSNAQKPQKGPSVVPVVDIRLMGWVLSELSAIRKSDFSDDLDFSSFDRYFYTAQNRALVRKNAHLDSLVDTRQSAVDQHFIDEVRCATFNEILLGSGKHRVLLDDARCRIKRVLRNFWKYFDQAPTRFGPGVALLDAVSKVSGYTPAKLENPCSTLKLYEYMRTSEYWSNDPFFFAWFTRPGNNTTVMRTSTEVFFTVPKDSSTDRGCSKQPSVNMTVQLRIGHALRMCLREVGILVDSVQVGDLVIPNQADYHGELLPKLWKDIATIDLKSASNTISSVLVESILPRDVFALLDAARCASIDLDGEVMTLERFSAMGNGFTFELESLIFYIISCISTEGEDRLFRSGTCTVFGDDIIVPIAAFERTCKNLRLLGFEINDQKSFGAGPFRESCGVDVFEGKLCRPVFLKDFTGPLGFVSLHNLIVKIAKLDDVCYDSSYRRLLLQLRAKAPRVPFGPCGEDDDTFFHDPTFDGFSFLTFKEGNAIITDPNQSGHYALRVKTKRVKPYSDYYYVWMWMALGFESEGYGIRGATSVRGLRFKKTERVSKTSSAWV